MVYSILLCSVSTDINVPMPLFVAIMPLLSNSSYAEITVFLLIFKNLLTSLVEGSLLPLFKIPFLSAYIMWFSIWIWIGSLLFNFRFENIK